MNRLKNKVAIITGAGQGIGEAIAKAFAKEGASLVISGFTLSKLERVEREILEETPNAKLLSTRCDITSSEDIATMVNSCISELGEPNVLINNAGRDFFHTPLETTEDEWDRCLKNDLTGAWLCAKAVLPSMLRHDAGAIVNISSVHGSKIIPHCFPYPIAKHGLNGLTRALAIEYAPQNIRVNSISPGLIITPLIFDIFQRQVEAGLGDSVEALLEEQRNILPSKRIGTSEEVAMLAVLLASDEAPYINGADIPIDGGRSILYHE